MLYHLVTLGCQMNKSDSERVATILEGMGYSRTENEEEANLLGVLACSVRQKSIDKVHSKIHKWNKLKNRHNMITFLSGCVLPADREKFLKQFDIVFLISELPAFPDMIRQYGIVTPLGLRSNEHAIHGNARKNEDRLLKKIHLSTGKVKMSEPDKKIEDFWHIQPSYHSTFEAFIPIQNGCNNFCTFCAVPYTRGREISRPSEEILSELKLLVNKGYKSITLLGQNVNSYGFDKNGKEIYFTDLLRKIGEFGQSRGKTFRVYFTSPHPRDMTEEVCEIISRYKCLAKQIHLPVQSGDDKVLMRMNRKYTLEDYREVVRSVKKHLPDATLFTDIIVGFTGETGEEFENTRKAMEEFKFNMAYIAKYSPRPGAVSSRWKDDIPDEVKTERLHTLTRELTRHTSVYNEGLIGKDLTVLVTGDNKKPGYLSAITEGRILLRFPCDEKSLVGNYVKVNIHSATDYSLEGTLVRESVPETVRL